ISQSRAQLRVRWFCRSDRRPWSCAPRRGDHDHTGGNGADSTDPIQRYRSVPKPSRESMISCMNRSAFIRTWMSRNFNMRRYGMYEFDNRDSAQMYEYLEARIEALKGLIQQLEAENEALRATEVAGRFQIYAA